jgi:hypothetical protein
MRYGPFPIMVVLIALLLQRAHTDTREARRFDQRTESDSKTIAGVRNNLTVFALLGQQRRHRSYWVPVVASLRSLTSTRGAPHAQV